MDGDCKNIGNQAQECVNEVKKDFCVMFVRTVGYPVMSWKTDQGRGGRVKRVIPPYNNKQ